MVREIRIGDMPGFINLDHELDGVYGNGFSKEPTDEDLAAIEKEVEDKRKYHEEKKFGAVLFNGKRNKKNKRSK